MKGKVYIPITLFFTGVAIMVLEILGTRIIAPYYGVSLYIWSALITVTLVALSIGYWLGGRIADKRATIDTLYLFIFLAGLWLILIPSISLPILRGTRFLGIRWGALVSAFFLFTIPLVLLGMTTPFAVKLLTNKLEALGTTAGNLYAISTVGSVFGAVLTGFILIPNIGVRKIVYLQALILIILWVAWKVLRRKYAKVLLATPFLLICILGQLHSPVLLAKNDTTIVYKANSFYGQVKVVDIKNSRWLLIDGTSHTVIDKDTGESLFEHSFYFEILHHFNQKAKDLLLLGMGGASVAKAFSEYGLAIDAVEIDPKVAEAAKKYFSAEQYIDNIFLCDARDYIMNTNKKYDLIILDTFSAAGHPFHLFTIESFKETKRILKKDGIIMVNSYGLLRGKDSLAYKSIARTLGNTFPYLKAYSLVMEPEECLGNVLLCASEEEFEFNDEIGYRNEVVKRFIKKMRRNEIKEVSTLSKEGLVLTDNYNPIEFWDINVNEATRRGIIHVFGNEVLLD